MPTSFDWRNAGYREWNALLFEHFLGGPRERTVDRIGASAEELRAAANDPTTDAQEILEAFLDAVRAELPKGRGFCTYCLRSAKASAPEEPPRFFAMLWFTCLLASGYPESGGSFQKRFGRVIGTEDQCRYGKDQGGCLDELWERLVAWLDAREGPKLVLPPPDHHKNVIGRSYYLAFPTRRDRSVLEDVLGGAQLVGFEPPILPMIEALERARGRFSSDFRATLDNFLDQFLRAGRDPKESAFWRAIRSQSASGLLDSASDGVQTAPLTFVASWDDDETLLVRLGSRSATSPTPGTQVRPLFQPVDGAEHYLTDESGSAGRIVERVLCGEFELPRGLASLVRQGVLVLVEESAGDFRLAVGEDVDGAELALVRSDLVGDFLEIFGGEAEESRFRGWSEVQGCRVRQLAHLPDGLVATTQLLQTTRAPIPRIVGGVRFGGGNYLWNPFFHPRIRSASASSVACRIGGTSIPCERSTEPGEWRMPALAESVELPVTVDVRATFDTEFGGRAFQRVRETSLRLVARGQGCSYKPVGSGRYWREGCRPEQSTQEGNSYVDSDLTTGLESESADLLDLEPSARYLGRGLGEMGSEPDADFPWLVVGPKRTPTELVYLGDLDSAVAPDGGEALDRGDRRVWSQAFRSARRIVARSGSVYVTLAEDDRLRDILSLYRRRAARRLAVQGHRVCASSIRLPLEEGLGHGSLEPTAATHQAVEALAALGQARAGIPLKEALEVMSVLTGRQDYLLWQHLLRGWSEAGVLDLLRRQDRSETLVVPRSPRFVMVRRGLSVEARLIGLAPDDLIAAVRGEWRGPVDWLAATTIFQPRVLRVRGSDPDEVARLSSHIGLLAPEWLHWPDASRVPTNLAVHGDYEGMSHEAPPDAYRKEANWDWSNMTFRRHPREVAPELVAVERRRHPQRCSIYVVLVDGDPMIWSYLRSWALLHAAELREQHPFRWCAGGTFRSSGRSPLHLPLPLGRLCAVAGLSLPGPEVNQEGALSGYCYPFGPRMGRAVGGAIPRQWVKHEGRE